MPFNESLSLFDFAERDLRGGSPIAEAPPATNDVEARLPRSAGDVLADMRARLRTLPIREKTAVALEETLFADEISANPVPAALERLVEVSPR